MPGSVAQLDAHPTADQEVTGSTPAGRLSMNYFLAILSLPQIQVGQLSFSGERMCKILVNCLED